MKNSLKCWTKTNKHRWYQQHKVGISGKSLSRLIAKQAVLDDTIRRPSSFDSSIRVDNMNPHLQHYALPKVSCFQLLIMAARSSQ